jgi:hypothetical protein
MKTPIEKAKEKLATKTQLGRLFWMLMKKKVSCLDNQKIGIGSALARRKKDLESEFNLKINTYPKKIRSKFSGRKITISEYELVK